jgi:hypothetical protein
VSEDIADEVLERALDADDNLSEDTKRFIDRHTARRQATGRAVRAPRHRGRPRIAAQDRHVEKPRTACAAAPPHSASSVWTDS